MISKKDRGGPGDNRTSPGFMIILQMQRPERHVKGFSWVEGWTGRWQIDRWVDRYLNA